MSKSSYRARIDIEPRCSRDEIFDVNDQVQELFLSGMSGDGAAHVWEHLREGRGLSDEVAHAEGLGYVPDAENVVRDFAVERGISLELMAGAGLLYRSSFGASKAFRSQRGRAAETDEELTRFFFDEGLAEDPDYYFDYPLCRTPDGKSLSGNWLTIPIRSRDGDGDVRIAGFQFRSMRPAEEIGKRGRYMSPLNSPAISWSEILIGLAEERRRIDETGTAVFAEGKFDQLAIKDSLRRVGVPDDRMPGVIALGGASIRGIEPSGEDGEFTAGVLDLVQARHVYLFMDGDDAGTTAAIEMGTALSRLGSAVSVVRVRDGEVELPDQNDREPVSAKDPGDLLKHYGPEGIAHALKVGRMRGIATFAAEEMEAQLAESPVSGQLRRRLEALDQMVPVLSALSDEVRQKAVGRVARSIGLDPAVISLAISPEIVQASLSEQGRAAGRRAVV